MSDAVDFFISLFNKNLVNKQEPGRYFRPRPYRNAVVRFRQCSILDCEERREILDRRAGLNVFLFPADKIPGCDLLSDSGTTTMTAEQWAAMILGDEAYGSNEGYFELKEQMAETFGSGWKQTGGPGGGGKETLFIFHQGRAAENAFFSVLSRSLRDETVSCGNSLPDGLFPELRGRIESRIRSMAGGNGDARKPCFIIPSNSHFDTTQGNIVDKNFVPLNMPCREHLEQREDFPFRGDMDLAELENLLEHASGRVPLVYLTVTNNTGGGQPVSMENIRQIRRITAVYGVPFFFDACRFAENAWFIRQKEKGYGSKSIDEIVREMFGHVDGFHISLKKDGLVNMGGAVMIREESDFTSRYTHFNEWLTDYQIMTEGHPTYGGLAGRDLKGIAQGLRTVVTQEYLGSRIGQVERFGRKLSQYGIPIVRPIGGHAVYIDMDRFFEGTARDEDFKANSFVALLMIAGHRMCELGLYAFGSFDGEEEIPPDPRVNYVRAAVPRLAYEDQDLCAAAEAVKLLSDNRDRIPGVHVEYGRDLNLRHFKSRFSWKLE